MKLLPGVKLNVGLRGLSLTVGKRGASVNVSKRGTRATVGLPGTGASYSTKLSGPVGRGEPSSPVPFEPHNTNDGRNAPGSGPLLFLGIIGVVIALAVCNSSESSERDVRLEAAPASRDEVPLGGPRQQGEKGASPKLDPRTDEVEIAKFFQGNMQILSHYTYETCQCKTPLCVEAIRKQMDADNESALAGNPVIMRLAQQQGSPEEWMASQTLKHTPREEMESAMRLFLTCTYLGIAKRRPTEKELSDEIEPMLAEMGYLPTSRKPGAKEAATRNGFMAVIVTEIDTVVDEICDCSTRLCAEGVAATTGERGFMAGFRYTSSRIASSDLNQLFRRMQQRPADLWKVLRKENPAWARAVEGRMGECVRTASSPPGHR